jgi:hydroxymethylbilane synthase
MHKTTTALVNYCEHIGVQLAKDFIDDGALEILKNAEEVAFKDEMPQRL